MSKSYITFYSDSGASVGQIEFIYHKDIYKGKTVFRGPIAKSLKTAIASKPPLYVPDLGGAGASAEGSASAWSWLVAIATYVTKGRRRSASSFKIKNAPPNKLFRKISVPPGALP